MKRLPPRAKHRSGYRSIAAALASLMIASAPAWAERIRNPVAVYAGLDKITGVTTNFEAPIGQAVAFGSFRILTSVCFTRPVTEEPKTAAFVQIDDTDPSGKTERIFSGWMFAESPGLHAVEHPVIDVWLTGCRDPNAPPPAVELPQEPPPDLRTNSGEETDPLD